MSQLFYAVLNTGCETPFGLSMNVTWSMSSGNTEEGPSVDMLGVSPKAHPGETHLLLNNIHPFDWLTLRVLNLCPSPLQSPPPLC